MSSPRRLMLLAACGGLLGLLGGAAAWVLFRLIALITNVALFHQWGWDYPSFADFEPGVVLIPVAMLGGLVVALLAKWSPVIRGHGIPETMEVVLTNQSRISPRAAVAKPFSAAIAIGTGGPFGAEGPIIVTGGALGSIIGQVFPVSPSERKILLASGAAAGMAATFGAPLAAVVLAIELLLFEFSTRALVPLLVASSVAGGMHALLFGSGPLFDAPTHDFEGLGQLWIFALLGLACGALAVLICKGLYLWEGAFRRLPIGEFWHPMIGAAAFALIGIGVPTALGVGYDSIDDVLANELALGALTLLLVAKLGAWWVALASGTSGGTLAPLLLISGAFGGVVGQLVVELAPGLEVSPGAFALVAMAATFGAATRATFTAIVFAFELTRDYEAILPIMLAAVIADLVASALLDHGLMTEKLARRGVNVPFEYEPDVMRTTLVGAAMTTPVATLPEDSPIAGARSLITEHGHSAYPLVDADGRCVGIVSRSDLLDVGRERLEEPVRDVASSDVVSVRPRDTLLTAIEQMATEGVDHLPVLDDAHRLVGICTRTDLLRARASRLEHDDAQSGWRPWRRKASVDGAA